MRIKSFETLEEMVDFNSRMEDEANAHVEEWQKQITYGDYFVVFEPSYELWAFCYVKTLDELFPPLEFPSQNNLDERHFEMEGIQERYERGYRFCDNYSIICPEGELGDCHILKALVKITKEEFEVCKKAGFDWDALCDADPAFVAKLAERLLTPGAVKHE